MGAQGSALVIRPHALPSAAPAAACLLLTWIVPHARPLLLLGPLPLQVRLQLHLPLQLVAMGLSSWHLPRMCAHFYPAVPASACSQSSTAMAAMFGYLLPTVGIRYLEQRSRSLFATQLRAAVAHQA